ncbi:12406_t:CDS:2 [Funneliformis caledonium]|uniref:12406_t:CDS:1 n=1 Tax=Funneliformis caledonium TaxID=1117310 RepID=A0A9N9EE23_9GLOM|nr:12406_t:CDS:2 [Funneliformis caledonium]
MISYSLAELSTDSSATNDPPGTLIEIDDRNPTMSRFQRAFKDAPKYFKVTLSEKRATKVDDKYKLRLDVSYDAFEIILKNSAPSRPLFILSRNLCRETVDSPVFPSIDEEII